MAPLQSKAFELVAQSQPRVPLGCVWQREGGFGSCATREFQPRRRRHEPIHFFDETMVEMAWPEIERAAQRRVPWCFLPTGVIEQHGPHMGLAVDIYCSWLLSCQQVRAELEGRRPAHPDRATQLLGGQRGYQILRRLVQPAARRPCKALVVRPVWSHSTSGASSAYSTSTGTGTGTTTWSYLAAIKAARDLAGVGAWAVLGFGFLARRLGLSGEEEEQALVFTSRLFPEHPARMPADTRRGVGDRSDGRLLPGARGSPKWPESLEPTRLTG